MRNPNPYLDRPILDKVVTATAYVFVAAAAVGVIWLAIYLFKPTTQDCPPLEPSNATSSQDWQTLRDQARRAEQEGGLSDSDLARKC